MSLLLHQIAMEYLPLRKRQNAKGWWLFDAPCCHHRGHNRDTGGRGNFLATGDGNMIANCYNCGFKARYTGGAISHGFEGWLGYLGVPHQRIQEAKLEILGKQLNGELTTPDKVDWFKPDDFKEISLPDGSQPLDHWLSMDEPPEEFLDCLGYLTGRGRAVIDNWPYHWSPKSNKVIPKDLKNRLIIPFYHRGRIVGWTARYAANGGKTPTKTIPKYHNSDLPQGYLFNGDVISARDRKHILLLEGPLDAIAVDGVGVLGSTLNKQQITWLNSVDVEKVVVPDREANNQDLIDTAVEQGWSVSFPEWESKIKDAADASLNYGRLYTVASIIRARTNDRLEIGVKRQFLGDR